jgi:hypothetical protein
MPATRSALSYDVFVAPEKPFAAPPPAVGDGPAWDPTTSTLIFGARDAVLVDPLTFRCPNRSSPRKSRLRARSSR